MDWQAGKANLEFQRRATVLELEAGLDDSQAEEQPDVNLLSLHAYWGHAGVDRRQVDADGGHGRGVGMGDRELEVATQHLPRIAQRGPARVSTAGRLLAWVRDEGFAEIGSAPKVIVPDELEAAVLRASFAVDGGNARIGASEVAVSRRLRRRLAGS